jgi:hypothetical protein
MAESKIEHDHHPEAVDAQKGTRRLELLGLNEMLAQPDSRRVFFAELGDEEYAKLLGYINSVMRKQPIQYDYGDSSPNFLVTPPPEDKAPLMEQTFKTIRSILGNHELDERAALRRAGLTMAGAINYVHPYGNGNGRTGRVAHYLMEFGSERGDQAFNDELYAIIAKVPVYDFDNRQAIYDTPPPQLERALAQTAHEQNPTTWEYISDRQRALEAVRVYLGMMEGNLTVPITEDVSHWYADSTQPSGARREFFPVGTITGDQLYERDYTRLSTVPTYSPEDIPTDAHRVVAERLSNKATTTLYLDKI